MKNKIIPYKPRLKKLARKLGKHSNIPRPSGTPFKGGISSQNLGAAGGCTSINIRGKLYIK